jgi:hypothetical protein
LTSTNARLRIHKIVAGNGALGGLVMLVVVALSIVAPTFLRRVTGRTRTSKWSASMARRTPC